MNQIEFQPFSDRDLPLWFEWMQIPHVKNVWLLDGYQPSESIHEQVQGNGYDFPFKICVDGRIIGFIQCCDLYAYRKICPAPKGLFTQEDAGTYCMDLFIADPAYLHKGYGTEIVRQFSQKVFQDFHAKKLLIDPAANNQRAIRCYEKAGFVHVKKVHDGVTDCVIMQILPPIKSTKIHQIE